MTYLNERAKPHVEPLARQVEAPIFMPLEVMDPAPARAVFDRDRRSWGRLDFLVHSIAFSPRDALQGRVVDCPRDGFLAAMDVSCWSFLDMAHLAEPLMKDGGTMLTMTYSAPTRWWRTTTSWAPVKAALESAVRYVAAELGPKGIRVHAISPGPLATRAASGIKDFDELMDAAPSRAPARRLVTIEDVGAACVFLASDYGAAMTGETLYVDGGYHIID